MNGIELIAAERQRQIEQEGWTPEHDAQHTGGEMADAGAVYADAASALIRGASVEDIAESYLDGVGALVWPWDDEWLKIDPDPIRTLTKAGALIAAQLDLLLQQQKEQA